MSVPQASREELTSMVKLAGAVILTSQGIPFLHAGVEFCRTKNGHGNSYNAPDQVNQIEWVRKSVYLDVFEYYRKLIRLRKNHPVFRMRHAELIRENLLFCLKYQVGVVSYCIKGNKTGDIWDLVLVIFNGNREEVNVPIPEGEFRIIARGDQIEEAGIETVPGIMVAVPPRSMLILAKSSEGSK
jgi:pullulanase